MCGGGGGEKEGEQTDRLIYIFLIDKSGLMNILNSLLPYPVFLCFLLKIANLSAATCSIFPCLRLMTRIAILVLRVVTKS